MATIEAAERRIDDLKGLRGGRLRLGSSFPIGVYSSAVLAEFRRRYPAVEVVLHILLSETVETKLLANELDLGLVSHDAGDPRLVARAFMSDELVGLCCWTSLGRSGTSRRWNSRTRRLSWRRKAREHARWWRSVCERWASC